MAQQCAPDLTDSPRRLGWRRLAAFAAFFAAVAVAVFTAAPAFAENLAPEPVLEPVPADILIQYMDDYVFSDLEAFRKERPKWYWRIDFRGDTRINQFVNRLGGDVKIYVDHTAGPSAHPEDRDVPRSERSRWIRQTIADMAGRAGISATVDMDAKKRAGADILVLWMDAPKDLSRMWWGALAEYENALEKRKDDEPPQSQTYLPRFRTYIGRSVQDMKAVFIERSPAELNCFYAGAVDESHVIRSGVIVIDKNLKWDAWRHCFVRGMMRLSGHLGGVVKSPSSMKTEVFQAGLNSHEKRVLSALYSSAIKNGMPRNKALRITEQTQRPGP